MVVHIRDGKGRKDRDVMLSPALLDAHAHSIGRTATQRIDRSLLEMADIVRRAGQSFMERSRRRLVALEQGNVTFRWPDSAHGNKQCLLTLPVDEFLRRFAAATLLPVPRRFSRYLGSIRAAR